MEERDPVVEEVKENFNLKKLQERVWRLEAENKELKLGNSILTTQHQSQVETQGDMLRQLYGEIEETSYKVQDREATIKKLEEELEDQRTRHQEQLDSERSMWENTQSGLEKKVEALEGELHELREFKENKIQMEGELASLKRQLQQQAEDHSQQMSIFDRQRASSRKDDDFQPRTDAEIKAIVDKWENYAHPRAREFFNSTDMLRGVLVQLAKGTDKSQDPILGSEDKCVFWQGEVTKEDLQAAIKMIKPGETEETVTYVNRVLAFIFATDDSFEALMQLPKEPFKMSCGDQLCVHLAHISLAVER